MQARTTLGAPPVITQPMMAQPVTVQQRAARVWPDAVRRYVQRAFAEENAIPGVGKSEIETKLKEVISTAAESQQLELLPWDQLPLPQMLIRDQQTAFQHVQSPGFPGISSMSLHDTNPRTPENSRKRKSGSQDLENDYSPQASTPPWRSVNAPNSKSLESRITQPSKRQKAAMNLPQSSHADLEKEKRRQRFQNKGAAPISRELDPEAVPLGPVVGRNQNLEKKYLRLTSAPNPEMVRPLPILTQTLDLLKRKWKQDNNYQYICDQFKSLRQDLTVQHIRNEFTVNVYEIHARIALEKGDLGEYNQCQTQLQALYAQKLGGHPVEFKAYRILYLLFTCSRSDMSDILAELTPAEKKEKAIKHALDARSALAMGNYHRFFKLTLETPNMGAYLMDKFVVRERLAALANICKAYKPDIKLRVVTDELAFDSDGDAATFICEHGNESFLQQDAAGDVRFMTGKVGNVYDEARRRAFGTVDLKGQI